jgi:formate C-acetyltransferase
MKMVGYSDHELENTYVLGGVDRAGKSVYNEVTDLFLKATADHKIIFPKIKCRYSFGSPKAYLDAINAELVKGTSTILYQNDDATIPAIVANGRPIEEARDYLTAGCWDVVTYEEKSDHGNYLNILKPFELAVHRQFERIEETKIKFDVFDDCKTFEEVYQILLSNSKNLIRERVDITRRGGRILHKVDRFPIFSSTLVGCMDSMLDYSMNGAKYRDDYYLLFGFPNIVDSMMAIKTLVFDEKKYTLDQLFTAVRNNWEGYEDIQKDCIRCHGWGDGNQDSCDFARRYNDDLYNFARTLEGSYGGSVNLGHLTYTEIRWWGEWTKATPDGRRDGEYFAQGLTPSRLKKIKSVNDVINSMANLDPKAMGSNSVVNIILPYGKTTLDSCEWFLRATAKSAIQSLQLNCVSKEQLLDAQKHPEKYPDLIVRVTGFSARFTALSEGWQQEVLTRNFYE